MKNLKPSYGLLLYGVATVGGGTTPGLCTVSEPFDVELWHGY